MLFFGRPVFSGLHIQNLGPGKCSCNLAPFEINLIFLQIWFSKCLFKLHFLSWNCYLWNSPHTIRLKLKNFKFSRRFMPLWKTLRLWWSPWQQFFTKDNIRNLFTLREGYTVKFFFQSISWNTNLTSISQCIFTLNSS